MTESNWHDATAPSDLALRLQRKPATDQAIVGDLYVNGIWQCFTLERAGVEIVPGRYEIVITPSTRFGGRLLPLILGVPHRAGLRIHPLNWAEQSEGCIGVGQDATVTSVEQSRLALAALQPRLAEVLARGGRVWLTIEPAARPPLQTV